jgi:hypothetical protein
MTDKIQVLQPGEITLRDLAKLLQVETRTISRWSSLGYFNRKVLGNGMNHPTIYDLETVKAAIVTHRLRISLDAYSKLFKGSQPATAA